MIQGTAAIHFNTKSFSQSHLGTFDIYRIIMPLLVHLSSRSKSLEHAELSGWRCYNGIQYCLHDNFKPYLSDLKQGLEDDSCLALSASNDLLYNSVVWKCVQSDLAYL